MGESEGPVSPGGSRILRHEPREQPRDLSPAAHSSVDVVDRHIEAHVGAVAMVFHELISELVHVDVHHVEPGPGRPYHTLVTSGMSERPMAAPPQAPSCTHAELVALLAPDWPVSQEAFADEANYWPVRQLKMLARLPHEYATWLWFDHTIPNGDPPEPFAPSTQLCCSLMLPSLHLGPDFTVLDASDGRKITFLCIVPLYREEMDYKLKKGTDALVDRFDKAGVDDIIHQQRPNACRSSRRRWFGGGA